MEITSVPAAEQERLWGDRKDKLRKYYTKYLNVEGIVIIGSDNVPDNAFYRAKDLVLKVTSKHLQIRGGLSGTQLRLAPPGSWITHLPELREFSHLRYGLSHISADGVVQFCAAVVEWEGKPNMGVLTHELGHAIVPLIFRIEPNFENLLNQAYERAAESGVWTNDWFFSQGKWEYWAEGVRMWTHDVGTGRRLEAKDAFIEYDPGIALLDNWLHVGDIPYEY